MSHPRQVMNGFTRRKPRKVQQTRSFSLAAFGMLILSHIAGAHYEELARALVTGK